MAKVIISPKLFQEIQRKFKGEAHDVIDLLETLEQNPRKGKELGNVGGIVIKELRFRSFRFYFITDGHKLKVMEESELSELLIRFVRMSDKKDQQKTIEEIKKILRELGAKGFS